VFHVLRWRRASRRCFTFYAGRLDWHERLQDLCQVHGLGADQREQLRRLLELVAADSTAPTTVRDPAAGVDVHVADSLAALELDEVRAADSIADVGAGAGFPGLPLAVALPASRVALVESAGRKCAFLERAIETAGVSNACVACARVEEWPERGLDLVCVRAVAPLAVLVEYAAPLLRIGGRLVAWKGRRDAAEEHDGGVAAAHLGLSPEGVVGVQPFAAAEHRNLHLYLKASETPAGYPRRPGMARKRPFSG
jgi:16S rRNA (guanine527-N7)-methyltransferase